MSSRRLLLENISSLTVLQGLNYAVPLITLPYLVRVLQPSHFGLLSLAQGIILYFDLFTDFGFNFSQTRAIAECKQSPNAVATIFWSTIYTKALLMCISAVVLTLLVALTPKLRETPMLYAVNFLYVIGTTLFPIWLFQGLERMKLGAALFGSARLMTIPALLLFVRGPQDYVIASAIQASVEVTASLLAWPVILRRMRLAWHPPSVSGIRDTLRRAWPLFLSSLAVQISTCSSVVILGPVAGKVEVGYFSAADKLIKASTAALNPIAQALYPHITAAKLRSSLSAFQLIRKALFAVGISSFLVSIMSALCARPICHMILGRQFENSIVVLQWLSPLPLLFGLTSVFGTQTMLVFQMDRPFLKVTVLTAALAIPLGFFLSLSFGVVGAAAASVITSGFLLVSILLALYVNGIRFWECPQKQGALFERDVEHRC